MSLTKTLPTRARVQVYGGAVTRACIIKYCFQGIRLRVILASVLEVVEADRVTDFLQGLVSHLVGLL